MQFTGTMGSRTLKAEHGIDPGQPWLCRTSCKLTKNGKAASILGQKAEIRSGSGCIYVCIVSCISLIWYVL